MPSGGNGSGFGRKPPLPLGHRSGGYGCTVVMSMATMSALITYSSCAVNKALQTAIPPKRIVERAWMEVF